MKKKPSGWLMVLVCLFLTLDLCAQEVKRLRPGDVFPKEVLYRLIKENGYVISEDSLKDKYIILDFWNIWCSTCIKGMPQMNSLQEIFKNDLLIVEVTKNTEKEVEALFKRLNKPQNNLISIKGDTILHDYFPKVFPLHVWIDSRGIIKYITNGYNATKEHVSSFLKGIEMSLIERGSQKEFGGRSKYIELIGSGMQKNVTGYSLLMKGRLEKSGFIDEPKNSYKLFKPGLGFYKQTLAELYLGAYSKEIFGKNASNISGNFYPISLDVADESVFIKPQDSNKVDLWEKDYLYNYESYYPLRDDELYKIFRQDLDRYFGYIVEIKPRSTRFLTIKKSGETRGLKNGSLTAWDIGNHLKKILMGEYFELRYEGKWMENLFIENAEFGKTIADLKVFLKLNGYELIEEWRIINWLVIHDSMNNQRLKL